MCTRVCLHVVAVATNWFIICCQFYTLYNELNHAQEEAIICNKMTASVDNKIQTMDTKTPQPKTMDTKTPQPKTMDTKTPQPKTDK